MGVVNAHSKNFFSAVPFDILAANGKSIAEVRAFTPKISIKTCTKQKMFSAD
ncbi:hypothetical protein CG08_0327 [Riemerella anatipestifer]|nr:hypothetical protein RIA_1983 [Riemerella anatipestifer RA-GD]AGC40629.1 hypothetical protein G148_1325 [Riemerella anatipestifer RA-CH-2]AKP68749.1 hypothetical protein CG08_0327 [Riemerella anatipestifer]AKP70594.1 hypothetical protein CG09_0316 [Riemerella anatipestifer]